MEKLLTVKEVIAELDISKSTFYYWRQLSCAPKAIKLPNGKVRVRRCDLDQWIEERRESAA